MIRTMLCPVDLTELSECVVRLAGGMAEQLGARVVLHHNIDAAPPSPLGVAWMWSEDHEQKAEGRVADAATVLDGMLADLGSVAAEARITRGPVDEAVHEIAREVAADLLVIGTHGAESPAHDSMTERIVLRAPCAVLALGDECRQSESMTESWLAAKGPLPVVVPCDFTQRARRAVAYALALASLLPLRLHLVHVVREPEPRLSNAERTALYQLRVLVPDSQRDQVSFHVPHGAAAPRILDLVAETGARFVLMAAHGKGLLRRALFGTTTLEMLHHCGAPVWFVPEGASLVANLAPRLQEAVE